MLPRQRHLFSVVILLATMLLPALTTPAKDKEFKAIVKHIEKQYGARRKRIPFLGVANFAVKFVHPAGVKGFKVAIFEDQDFSSRPESVPFSSVMREAYTKGWQPLVQSRSREQRSYIYARTSGKDVQFAVTIFESRSAFVVEAKLNPDAAMKYLGNPELLGNSLIGGFRDDARMAAVSGRGNVSSLDELARLSRSTAPPPVGNQSQPPPASHPVLNGAKPADETPNAEINPSAQPVANEVKVKPPDKDTIRVDSSLVNLNVKALDKSGQPVSNLSREDFAVYENGVRQEITHFTPVTAPVHLVLLLDLSGSTKGSRQVMAEAAKRFIDSLGPNDRVALAAFTRKFYALSDFTTDRAWLKGLADKIGRIEGGTAFYDAMWKTLDLLDRVREPRKAIVVLTDGIDESLLRHGRESTEHTFDELLARAAEEDTIIYPIHLDRDLEKLDERLQKARLRAISSGHSDIGAQIRARVFEDIRRPHETAREQLSALAEQTSGVVFTAKGDHDLDDVYRRVAAELHQFYSLAYSPEGAKRNGEFRKINVGVSRDGVVAKTRRGYYDK